MTFSQNQKKQRAIRRLAELLRDHWEEGRVGSTRVFEHIIPDEWVIRGRSHAGGKCREHVVPCAYIRDECIAMYGRGKAVDEVAEMIEKHLAIVLISEDEKQHIDHTLGWKTNMPPGWEFGVGDPFARLRNAGVAFTLIDE